MVEHIFCQRRSNNQTLSVWWFVDRKNSGIYITITLELSNSMGFLLQGVTKPLRPPPPPPHCSTLRTNDITKYFIPNCSPSKTASISIARKNIVHGIIQISSNIHQNVIDSLGSNLQKNAYTSLFSSLCFFSSLITILSHSFYWSQIDPKNEV